MKKIIFITFCLLHLLMFSTSNVNACSCGFDTDTKSIFSRSDAVFIGKVLRIETVKETGLFLPFKETSDGLKPTRWEKDTERVQSVTFQIIESFKGTTENTFTVTSPAGGCFKVAFVTGKSYLVLARKIRPYTIDETDEPYEKQLKEKVNKLNRNLSFYRTGGCDLTHDLESNEDEYLEMRNFLKNGTWKESKITSLQQTNAQQFSYERSSQAQSLTCPPILLSAAGYVDIRRLAFQVCGERMLN